jgi:hypothetical protein
LTQHPISFAPSPSMIGGSEGQLADYWLICSGTRRFQWSTSGPIHPAPEREENSQRRQYFRCTVAMWTFCFWMLQQKMMVTCATANLHLYMYSLYLFMLNFYLTNNLLSFFYFLM